MFGIKGKLIIANAISLALAGVIGIFAAYSLETAQNRHIEYRVQTKEVLDLVQQIIYDTKRVKQVTLL